MTGRLEPPVLTTSGDGFLCSWREIGVKAEFDRFQDAPGGIYAEILVSSDFEGDKPYLLHAGRINLLLANSRGNAVSVLMKRGLNIDWDTALEQACFLVVQKYREGEPAIDLRDVNPFERPRWLVKPYVEHGGPTVLFAPGGSHKSYLGLAIAITAATGARLTGWLHGDPKPVLFVDWETDRWTHAERLQAICRGANIRETPAIYYRRMNATLAESVAAIRKEADRLDVGMVVYDSLGAGCGGELESAETVIKFFNAVRSIGKPALIISHVSKATAANTGGTHRLSPFGSVYTENAARNTWSIHRAGDEDSDSTSVALVHEKTNNGRYQKRHAYAMQFDNVADDDENDLLVRVEIRAVDLSSVPEFDTRQPLKERILACLQSGALDCKALAERLGVSSDQVYTRCRELKVSGRLTQLQDKRYGLLQTGAPV